MAQTKKMMLYAAFACYCAAMVYLLFWQRRPYQGPLAGWEYLRAYTNLVPFGTIRQLLALLRQGVSARLIRFAVVNLGGNVGVFLPPGFLLPCIWARQRRFGVFFLTVAAAVIGVELAQLALALGVCDIDDLILNLLGGSAGFLLWKLGPVNRWLAAHGFLLEKG